MRTFRTLSAEHRNEIKHEESRELLCRLRERQKIGDRLILLYFVYSTMATFRPSSHMRRRSERLRLRSRRRSSRLRLDRLLCRAVVVAAASLAQQNLDTSARVQFTFVQNPPFSCAMTQSRQAVLLECWLPHGLPHSFCSSSTHLGSPLGPARMGAQPAFTFM